MMTLVSFEVSNVGHKPKNSELTFYNVESILRIKSPYSNDYGYPKNQSCLDKLE